MASTKPSSVSPSCWPRETWRRYSTTGEALKAVIASAGCSSLETHSRTKIRWARGFSSDASAIRSCYQAHRLYRSSFSITP